MAQSWLFTSTNPASAACRAPTTQQGTLSGLVRVRANCASVLGHLSTFQERPGTCDEDLKTANETRERGEKKRG